MLPGAYLDEIADGRTFAIAQEQVVAFKRQLRDLFEDADILLTPTLA